MRTILVFIVVLFGLFVSAANAHGDYSYTLANNVLVDGKSYVVVFKNQGKVSYCLTTPERYGEPQVACFHEGETVPFNQVTGGNYGDSDNWMNNADDGSDKCLAGLNDCPIPKDMMGHFEDGWRK